MKKSSMSLLFLSVVMVVSFGFSARADARIVYSPPPEFFVEGSPDLVIIPGTYVYRIPDIELDILFYQGHWFRPFEGRWYRSRHHNGPWAYVGPGRVPGVLLRLPGDYRGWRYEPRHRIHYGDLHRNWRAWERHKHWDRDDRWREGRHGDRGHGRDRDRGHRGGRDRGHRGDRDHGRR